MNFEEALKAHWDDFVRYSRALAGSRESGDDLLQESLVRAWRGYEKLESRDSFKQWVLRIILNTHKSQCRLGWVKRLVGLEAAESIPAPDYLPYEEKELVRIAMRKLPVEQREALILFEVLGMSVMEIAELKKVTLSAVKSRLARGRERLQRQYAELDGQVHFERQNPSSSVGLENATVELGVATIDSRSENAGISRRSR